MKFFSQNRAVSIAIAVSLLLHGILLSVRFISPEAFHIVPADPSLEIVLVNAKHGKKPQKADALAQANLEGGGTDDAGRIKTPLPVSGNTSEGANLASTQQKEKEMREQQRQLVEQAKQLARMAAKSAALESNPSDAGKESNDSLKPMYSRRAGEIERNIEEQSKRPKARYITPSTREVGYAMYYKTMQRRIEDIGTLNFPQMNGKKLYGELLINIPVYQDGTIYERDGGPTVVISSGNPALDSAALKIVRRSAPFGPFPANMRSKNGGDLWVVVSRFKFTKEQGLQTQLQSSSS